MPVDSFKYLPRVIAYYYRTSDRQPELPIPWTPLPGPLSECTFGLVTTGGLYHQSAEPPFDLEREKAEPTWGDPTYRTLPTDIAQAELGASHLHINTRDVLQDINILLPLKRFQELLAEGRIGGLARHGYSFMGYQGFPADTTAWRETYGPEVAEKLKSEGVQCVLLTPA
jgi:D-proline reductase (dithiol) PrdB